MCRLHLSRRNILIISIMIYLLFNVWIICSFLWIFKGSTHNSSSSERSLSIERDVVFDKNEDNDFMRLINMKEVHIWDKAGGTGLYLWEDILNADIVVENGGLSKNGKIKINDITFRFRSGKLTYPEEIDLKTRYLVLLLNTRVTDMIPAARYWMDSLQALPLLKSFIIMLLGDEQCHNGWIEEYTEYYRGQLKAIFVVYDDRRIGNGLWYQWPLGVAKYRGFEVQPQLINLVGKRKYMCNFLGTIYPKSSREYLMNLIKAHNLETECLMNVRLEWHPHETEESLNEYLHALGNSDMTLSPVGQNSECYRMLEACAYGSVPVVEEVMTPGACEGSTSYINTTSPFKLIKRYNPPFIFVKSWDELPAILGQERNMSLEEKVKRRLTLLEWYDHFKLQMKSIFVNAFDEKFFFS